jgi:aspartyl-tRNA(Asn)/glutamyl-tRNA(Gln) amidotransferase subunit B
MGDAMTGYNEVGRFTVPPARLAELIELVAGNVVSHQAAKKVFASPRLADPSAGSTRAVAEALGLTQVSDTSALADWVEEVLTAHPKEVERYRAGEAKLIGFFVGQVMKKSQGKADPKGVQPVLVERLNGK